MMNALLLMLVAMSLIPAGDAAGKLLMQAGVAPSFVAWSRFWLGGLMAASVVGFSGLKLLTDWRIWLRGGLLAGGISSIQFALKTAPLGDVFAAFFIGPLVSFILAAIFLREPISFIRCALLALGFFGVLLVAKPGFGMQPGLEFALLAGCFYGSFLTASRWLRDVAPANDLLMTQLAIGALILTPTALPNIPEISLNIVWLTALSAGCSMLGNLLLLHAYKSVPATKLAPMVYFQLFAAIALGAALFGETPDYITWCGIALIIGSGIASARLR